MPNGSGGCGPIHDVSPEEVERAVRQLQEYWASLAEEPRKQPALPLAPGAG
jgi:hypothetical protein